LPGWSRHHLTVPSGPIPVGKLPAQLLDRLLGELGTPPPEVVVGPAVGEDACAIRVPPHVLVVASDPITFAGADVGRAAVIVNANDIAVMGARPRWFLATVVLPVGCTEPEVAGLFHAMEAALAEVGARLVGGHTEISGAVRQPLVVGMMLGITGQGRVIRTGGVRPGDVVVQIGPVPVEGAAVLAGLASTRLSIPPDVLRAALAGADHPGLSVVRPALHAAALGATAMHDLTEGGLAGGLWEMANAAGVGLRLDREEVLWFEPGLQLCRALGADPWRTLASGSMLAAFRPADADRAIERLIRDGYQASPIASAVDGDAVQDREGRRLEKPDRDEVARLLEAVGDMG
jgi:hydrogenase expression/formation protein HypE